MIIEQNRVKDQLVFTYQEEAKALQAECAEAIGNGNWDSVALKIQKNMKELELLQNRLGVFQNDHMKQAYYLGQIAAISMLCQRLKNEYNDAAEARLLKKNSPLLEKCIAYIGENQMVTSGQIVAGLKLKNRSDFSNAVSRQKKYGFIINYKMGNKNLYTLSGKGKKYYLEHLLSERKADDPGKEITVFVNTLTDKTKSGMINPVSFAMEMAKARTNMKAYYVSREFNQAMNGYKKAYMTSVWARIRDAVNSMGIRAYKTVPADESYNTIRISDRSVDAGTYGSAAYIR